MKMPPPFAKRVHTAHDLTKFHDRPVAAALLRLFATVHNLSVKASHSTIAMYTFKVISPKTVFEVVLIWQFNKAFLFEAI